MLKEHLKFSPEVDLKIHKIKIDKLKTKIVHHIKLSWINNKQREHDLQDHLWIGASHQLFSLKWIKLKKPSHLRNPITRLIKSYSNKDIVSQGI